MRRQQGGERRRAGRADRSERTAVFGKTKLCKFHILGVCSKGAECNFAHEAVELNQLPDLAKTKVCKALINTGHCDDPECRYAHNKEELRETPSPDPNSARLRAPAPGEGAMNLPNASSPAGPMNPNYGMVFGQSMNGMPQDPQAQAAVLQQLAAQLSMQAAMIQASHGNGWPGPQPCGQSPGQWLLPHAQPLAGGEAPDRDTRSKGIPVELASLTPQPTPPAYPQGRAVDAADAPVSANGRQQRRINVTNARHNVPKADGPRVSPSMGQPPSSYEPVGQLAAPYEPVKLPTAFEQDTSALQLGSLFHPAQSSGGSSPELNAWASPMLGPTIKEPEDPSPRGRLDSDVWELREEAEPDDAERRLRLPSQGGEKRLQDTPVLGGIMVKHTFLDIQPEGPKAGMRSVQTHSGSLCLMTARDEDDDDE